MRCPNNELKNTTSMPDPHQARIKPSSSFSFFLCILTINTLSSQLAAAAQLRQMGVRSIPIQDKIEKEAVREERGLETSSQGEWRLWRECTKTIERQCNKHKADFA